MLGPVLFVFLQYNYRPGAGRSGGGRSACLYNNRAFRVAAHVTRAAGHVTALMDRAGASVRRGPVT